MTPHRPAASIVLGTLIAIAGCVLCANAEGPLAWVAGMATLCAGVGLLAAQVRVGE